MIKWRAVVVAMVFLAGCSSSGVEPSSSATARTPQSTTTTADAGVSTVLEPALDSEPTSGAHDVVESVPPGDAASDNPVPRAAQPPPRRPGNPAAARTGASTNNIDRIDIPKIGLSHRTYEGIDLPTINRGPSHWPGTALPGQRGNTVFPGHRTTYTRPFWDIDKLAVGDEVTFTTASGRFVYRVTETLVVGSNDLWITDPTEEATFTIFACHPKGSAKQRYVVKGRLTSPPADAPAPPTTTAPPPSSPPSSSTTTTTSPPPDERPPLLPGLPD